MLASGPTPGHGPSTGPAISTRRGSRATYYVPACGPAAVRTVSWPTRGLSATLGRAVFAARVSSVFLPAPHRRGRCRFGRGGRPLLAPAPADRTNGYNRPDTPLVAGITTQGSRLAIGTPASLACVGRHAFSRPRLGLAPTNDGLHLASGTSAVGLTPVTTRARIATACRDACRGGPPALANAYVGPGVSLGVLVVGAIRNDGSRNASVVLPGESSLGTASCVVVAPLGTVASTVATKTPDTQGAAGNPAAATSWASPTSPATRGATTLTGSGTDATV